MRLVRAIFPTPIRLMGAAIITSIDVTPGSLDEGKYALELRPDLHTLVVTVLQGGLAGRVFGVPMSAATWEFANYERPAAAAKVIKK